MSLNVEKAYENSPAFLQNLAVTLRGWYFIRKRFGGDYSSLLDQLMRSQWMAEEQFRQMQVCLLRQLIKEAVSSTPGYREKYDISPDAIDKINLYSLPSLPIVEKWELRDKTKRFVNPSRMKFGNLKCKTSGTSGSPLFFPYDLKSIQLNEAFRSRQLMWAGVNPFLTSAHFSGHNIIGKHNEPPFWRYNAARRQWLFSIYHQTDYHLNLCFDKLLKIKPSVIDGFPSALFVLARWIVARGKEEQVKPWAILTTAETLTDEQRMLIKQAFGCRVFDYYSSSEGAPYITECEAGGHHINPESGIVEIIKADGTYAQTGEIGELVVTSFFQRSMPLIRYRIADSAIAGSNDCPCGRAMPLIESIEGRLDDLLWTPERGYVGRLTTVLKCIPPVVKETQIAQTAPTRIEVRYSSGDGPIEDQYACRLNEAFKERLGKAISIEYIHCDTVPKGPNGKFRTIVREFSPPTDV